MDLSLRKQPAGLKLSNDEITITVQTELEGIPPNAVYIYINHNRITEVTTSIKQLKMERIVSLEAMGKTPLELKNAIESEADPQHGYWLNILGLLGCSLVPAKSNGKAQHKFKKQLSDMPFYVDYEGSQAIVYWRKRAELVIQRGATMRSTAPLNQDGKLGFSARFAEQLRAEHSTQFENFVTTEDIILKSVNEVGLFLYYGGTNSWLILKNQTGKTIDELSKVN